MLEVKHIRKEYKTGGLVQKALDDVSLQLRDNEFVAILGPSGSGKTTLLNIIGGLDRYDSGNLIINGISTKHYKDRDWDSYRNHTIGFVFQSYNLIPHQTILSNVELALTISGISKSERRKRAKHALQQVGLGEQVHKKPNQLSGGQMQRVAIARALVNDPDILLADEPTGALDSDTSAQVMDLLKEVAKDRLVVMVTHNPELAEEYATRIVNLKDGKIISDTHPFEMDETPAEHKNMGKTSMSLLTSLALSFNNLKTKKGRTILTAFAGSIGIIGIALILSLSNGVNTYIKNVEEETLSEYPLILQSSGFDMKSMIADTTSEKDKEEAKGDIQVGNMLTTMFSTIGSNDLTSLKAYLDSDVSNIKDYTNAIEYTYQITPQIYRDDTLRQVHPDTSFQSLGLGSSSSTNSMMSTMMSTDVFKALPQKASLYTEQYDVKAGRWPENKNECVLILTAKGNVMDFLLYTLGLRDADDLDRMVEQFSKEEEVDVPKTNDAYDYDDMLGIHFKVINASQYYEYDSTYGVWKDKREDLTYMKDLISKGEDLTIVGVVQPKEGATAAMLGTGIYYTNDLVMHTMKTAEESEIVKQQLANPQMNVFSGKRFDEKDTGSAFDMRNIFTIDEAKLRSAFTFDESKLQMDLSALNGVLENSDLPPFDMGSLLSQLNLTLSEEDMQLVLADLLAGYDAYIQTHPEADYTKLGEHLVVYLQSPEAGEIVKQGIEDAIKENGEIKITPEQMQKILADVFAGFEEYAKVHDLPDVSKMNEHFIAYLQSEEAKTALDNALATWLSKSDIETQVKAIMETYLQEVSASIGSGLQQNLSQFGTAMGNAFQFDAKAFQEAIQIQMSEQDMSELLLTMMSKKRYTYEENLKQLSYADPEKPSQIAIYPKDFESKEEVLRILDDYNAKMEKVDEDKVVTYTDVVGTLMSSVSDIVNVISYVLVAFVAISLVVSSIMIGVITYISVLERKKEIGILRAIGASKRNISEVFNAETFIIGLLAGVIGIVVTLLLLIPANEVIYSIAGQQNINASLPPVAGLILILLSTVLTLIGGIIPSRKAAKEDPVTALRTE